MMASNITVNLPNYLENPSKTTICECWYQIYSIGKHFPDAQNLSGEHCSRACEVFLSLILGGAILSWLSSGVVILSWESLDSSEGEGVLGGVSREGMGWSLKQGKGLVVPHAVEVLEN